MIKPQNCCPLNFTKQILRLQNFSVELNQHRSGFSAESRFCFLKIAAVCRRAATEFFLSNEIFPKPKWNLFTTAVFGLKKL